jgi:hypothetical protein
MLLYIKNKKKVKKDGGKAEAAYECESGRQAGR